MLEKPEPPTEDVKNMQQQMTNVDNVDDVKPLASKEKILCVHDSKIQSVVQQVKELKDKIDHISTQPPSSGINDTLLISLCEKIDTHIEKDFEWKSETGSKVDKMLTGIDNLNKNYDEIIDKVEHHESLVQQGKGIHSMSRAVYVLVGAAFAAIVWFYSHIVSSMSGGK